MAKKSPEKELIKIMHHAIKENRKNKKWGLPSLIVWNDIEKKIKEMGGFSVFKENLIQGARLKTNMTKPEDEYE